MNSESIRTFRLGDIHGIMEIEREAFPKGRYPKELMMKCARAYPESFIVIEVEKELAGYLIYDREGHVVSMAVKPAFRRKGLGRKMFTHAQERVGERLWLEVRSKNAEAIRFYKSMGMEITGKVPGYYETDDALVMVDEGKPKRFVAES